VAGGGHIALSALRLVCCAQAAARRMVVELSLIASRFEHITNLINLVMFYSRADRRLRGKADRSGTRSGRAAKLIAATTRIDAVTPMVSPSIP
jgi:hypothetical protein